MPKIGQFDYPTLKPEEAIEISTKLIKTFNGKPETENAFASAIGHKDSKSGTYIRKIADMRKYGLISKGQGIESTNLTEKLVNYKDEKERQNAMKTMFQNIPLMNVLIDRLKGKPSKDDFWIILSDIAKISREEAKNKANSVSKFYNKMLSYISNVLDEKDKSTSEDNDSTQPEGFKMNPTPNISPDSLFLQAGDIKLQSALTPDKITIAIQLLNSLLPKDGKK